MEWYYVVSASRDEAEIRSNLSNFSLLGDITKAVNGLNPASTALNLGINFITQPPGSDYCDVYLLRYENMELFKSDQNFSYILEGTRENVKSAKVKISCCKGVQYYIGIQNRDSFHGIHVGIEAIAITKKEFYDYSDK